jgi:hypothetical protein
VRHAAVAHGELGRGGRQPAMEERQKRKVMVRAGRLRVKQQ